MSITLVRKSQIRPLNIIRSDINTTTSGSALITKVIAGTGLTLSSSTGINPGTGDVTIALSIASASVLGGVKIGSGLTIAVDGTISVSSITWGSITGTLSNQTDLQAALDAKYNNPTGTSSQYIDGTGAYQTFPTALATGYVRHEVKAGVAINKGQAVYVTSSDGTNMIVGLASNASESTSSKTMGLLDRTVSTNGFANVVTEGLLAGLNTVGANAGDPVWLGTGGNLIYGLANKPYAPTHLVFIGIVTRVNANNGEIFVKVQNGFELNEIHDVDTKSSLPITGQLLRYDSDGLWKNWTPNYITSSALTGYATETWVGNNYVRLDGTSVINNTLNIDSNEMGGTYRGWMNRGVLVGGGGSDGAYFGMKVIGPNNAHTVIAWGDDSGDDLYFINTISGGPVDGVTYMTFFGSQNTIRMYKQLDVQSTIYSSEGNSSQWSAAYAWGNHASAGYLTGYTETDPTVPSHVKSITTTNIANWNSAYSWGNHGAVAYLRGDLAVNYTGNIFKVYTRSGEYGSNTGEVNTLQIFQDTPQADAFQTFHIAGDYAVHFGLDGTTNDLFVGGWSAGSVKNKIWHAGNITPVPTSRTITINGTTYDLSANRSWTIAGGVASVNAGTGVSVNQTTGAVTVSIGQSVATNATPSFDQVHTTNNGNGLNFKVGDDTWLGDINLPNTLSIIGQQDTTQGYISFGSDSTRLLGRAGTGPLTWAGHAIWTESSFTSTNVSNWNTAYSWGNHASQGYLTSVTNISGYAGTLLREDNRTISPSELTAGQMKFGFTSWNNNNTSPYADFIHMRSYTDSSGGTDNLVMFLKNGIGMRIWQQSWGSSSAYVEYVDVWTTGNFTQTNVNNWNTAYLWGNHGSQGYATVSYVTTQINNLINSAPGVLDTLSELATALGNDPNFATTVTNSIAAKLPLAGGTMTGDINWTQTDRGLTWGFNTDGAYIKFFNTGDADADSRLEYATSDNGDEYHRWVIAGTEKMNLKWAGLSVANSIWMGGNLVATQTWVTSQGYLTSLPSHNHDGVYVPINPDGDGPAWEYSDQNPTINGTYIGGRQSFGADGDANTGGAIQSRLINAYDGHVNSTYGYYVGLLNYGGDSGIHTTTQVIDSSGRWVGLSISDTYISSATIWNTAYGWGNHASAGYATQAWVTSRGYITGYTETDTLNSVTGRGATTSNSIQVGKLGIGRTAGSNESISVENPEGSWLIQAFRSGTSVGGLHTNNGILYVQGQNGTEIRLETSGNVTWSGNIIATRTWVSSQGYLTSYSETDTLATVTARGASTGSAVTLSSTANHFSGHHYFDAYDANGNHYPHYNPGGSNNGSKLNLRMFDSGGSVILFYLNGATQEISWGGNAIWHAGNDGAGSGLDADLLDGRQPSTSGGGNLIAQYASNGYLYVNNWIHPANGTGLFYDSGPHFYENAGEMYSSHALRVNGRLYLNDSESANLYGIRGRFTNDYIHLYNKVGIGHPGGWGQGEGNTPVYGLSTYGGINVGYGYDGGATLNTYTRINKDWGGGDFGGEQFSIVGTNASLALRSTNSDAKWLIHTASDNTLHFYFGDTYANNAWSSLYRFDRLGNLEISGALNEQSSFRFKENIVSLESISDKVEKLRPVRYNKIGNTATEIGLIAEEVAEVFPEFVNYNANGEVESLNYTRLSVVLLQTVKELSDKINKLETK